MTDAIRLAIGTLTRLPVPAPRKVDRTTAAVAMLLAPVVGALLGLVVGLAAWGLVSALPSTVSPLLVAVLAIAALAYLTRGLHLDGLADTADALGSGRPPSEALAIARRSDIGPFGVVTLVLVLLTQVAALAGLVADGRAAIALVVALGASRLALVVACAHGVPAARSEGLGAAVAGSVPVAAAVVEAVVWVLALSTVTAIVAPGSTVATASAIVGALLVASAVVAICVRRMGGITGDVLGAVVELSCAAGLVILVAVPA